MIGRSDFICHKCKFFREIKLNFCGESQHVAVMAYQKQLMLSSWCSASVCGGKCLTGTPFVVIAYAVH